MKKYERITTPEKLERYSTQLVQATKRSKVNLGFTIGCIGLALANFSSPEIFLAISNILQNEQLALSDENIILVNGLGIAWTICSVIAGAGTAQELSRKAYLEQLISDLEAQAQQPTYKKKVLKY